MLVTSLVCGQFFPTVENVDANFADETHLDLVHMFDVVQQHSPGVNLSAAVFAFVNRRPMDFNGVFPEGTFSFELFVTLLAGKVERVAVPKFVVLQNVIVAKGQPTRVTLEHLSRSVKVSDVNPQISEQFVAFLAVFATVLGFAFVVGPHHVLRDGGTMHELAAAEFANPRLVLNFNV